eukprot:5580930-Lingulodinium_polyedra.AAC.1
MLQLVVNTLRKVCLGKARLDTGIAVRQSGRGRGVQPCCLVNAQHSTVISQPWRQKYGEQRTFVHVPGFAGFTVSSRALLSTLGPAVEGIAHNQAQ